MLREYFQITPDRNAQRTANRIDGYTQDDYLGFLESIKPEHRRILIAAPSGIVLFTATDGTLRNLPIANNSLGGIWAPMSLDGVPNEELPVVLGEFQRTLSPTGMLFLSLRSGADAERIDRESRERHYHHSERTMRTLLESLGFRIVNSKMETVSHDGHIIQMLKLLSVNMKHKIGKSKPALK